MLKFSDQGVMSQVERINLFDTCGRLKQNRTRQKFYFKHVSVHAQVEYEKKANTKYMQDIHNMGAVLFVWK